MKSKVLHAVSIFLATVAGLYILLLIVDTIIMHSSGQYVLFLYKNTAIFLKRITEDTTMSELLVWEAENKTWYAKLLYDLESPLLLFNGAFGLCMYLFYEEKRLYLLNVLAAGLMLALRFIL